MHNEFTAVIAPAPEGGYVAYCLEVPAVGEGETVEECRQKLREAILLMLTDRRETERLEAPSGAWEERLAVVE
jgi:predicted RNase H-like HicB family nuclease